MICQAAVNHRNVYEFSRFLDYDTEYTTGVTGRSAEDAHLFMESDHTSNVLKGPCLLQICHCFVFSLWTFDFRHCSLSPHFIL